LLHAVMGRLGRQSCRSVFAEVLAARWGKLYWGQRGLQADYCCG